VTRRLAIAVVWLLCGEAIAGALFWTLLGVPESSAWTLALSLLLTLLILTSLLWTAGGVFALWRQPPAPVAAALRRAPRHAVAVLAGSVLFFTAWWATAQAMAWHQAYAGQIDAWIIANSGRSETKVLHHSIDWAIWTVRWGIGLTLALSLIAEIIANGWVAFGRARWVGRACHPKLWLTMAALVLLTQFLPWQHVAWRPHRLNLSAEPWFVGAKLTTIALVSAAGAVLAVSVVTPRADREDRST
jgi:hypothetical protein